MSSECNENAGYPSGVCDDRFYDCQFIIIGVVDWNGEASVKNDAYNDCSNVTVIVVRSAIVVL